MFEQFQAVNTGGDGREVDAEAADDEPDELEPDPDPDEV